MPTAATKISFDDKVQSGNRDPLKLNAGDINDFKKAINDHADALDVLAPINRNAVVYVDVNGDNTKAAIGNSSKPYKTIDAALDATSTYASRTVHIGIGRFASPTWGKIKGYTTFLGSGQPSMDVVITPSTYTNYNDPTPTKLVGGTIFEGTFLIPYNVHNVQGGNFGVDVGSDWVTNKNGGVYVEGFICGNSNPDNNNTAQNGKAMRTGITFWNITALQSAANIPVHTFLEENNDRACFTNIVTWGGFAGVVSKSRCTKWKNVTASGAGSYAMVLKNNDYAYFYHSSVDGLTIIGGTGLAIHNESGDGGLGMQGATVMNAKIIGTTYGVKQMGNAVSNVSLSYIDVVNCTGIGFQFNQMKKSRITNCTVDGATKGFEIVGSVDVVSNTSRNTSVFDFDLIGVSSTEGILAANNRGVSTGFKYGSYVFTGGGNYGIKLSGAAIVASEQITPVYPVTGGTAGPGAPATVVSQDPDVQLDAYQNYYSPTTANWENGILFNATASVAAPHSMNMWQGRNGQSGMLGLVASNAFPLVFADFVFAIYLESTGNIVLVQGANTAVLGTWTLGSYYIVQIDGGGRFSVYETPDGTLYNLIHNGPPAPANTTFYFAGLVGQGDAIISRPKYA